MIFYEQLTTLTLLPHYPYTTPPLPPHYPHTTLSLPPHYPHTTLTLPPPHYCSYSLKSSERALLPFALTSGTGQLTTTKRLDRELRKSYTFTVYVADGGMVPRKSEVKVCWGLVVVRVK